MTGPLSGVRVVEVANWLAAPAAAALMADMGADVIKVEPPGGEAWRNFDLQSTGYESAPPFNVAFDLDNRGKRSISIALDRPGAAALVRRLAASADVFITNLIQRRRERYGLTAPELLESNARLVYASLSGYGTSGPDAGRAGFDYAAFWARSGVMGMLGEPEAPPPLCSLGQGDHTTALNLLAGTLAALRLRDATGVGQLVDVSLLGTGMWTIGTDLVTSALTGERRPRHDRTRPSNPLLNTYRCRDQRWILLNMPQADAYWSRFCRAIGHDEWESDPRYDSLVSREQSSAELTAELDAVFATRPLSDWAESLDAVDVIWAPVAELPEIADDPTVSALDVFTELEHPDHGSYRTLATPFHIEGADVRARGPAPAAGEHTQQLLSELGLDSSEVADLAAEGVFG
jgi:crotonobetainyl-CoA:carnitine CoA-transferase CaiB-like acyl-CoA transferase